jgi:hypothetical protein
MVPGQNTSTHAARERRRTAAGPHRSHRQCRFLSEWLVVHRGTRPIDLHPRKVPEGEYEIDAEEDEVRREDSCVQQQRGTDRRHRRLAGAARGHRPAEPSRCTPLGPQHDQSLNQDRVQSAAVNIPRTQNETMTAAPRLPSARSPSALTAAARNSLMRSAGSSLTASRMPVGMTFDLAFARALQAETSPTWRDVFWYLTWLGSVRRSPRSRAQSYGCC